MLYSSILRFSFELLLLAFLSDLIFCLNLRLTSGSREKSIIFLNDTLKSGLRHVAESLVQPDKGILAADESTGTIAKRLSSVGVENNERTRRAYRQMLFTTAGLQKYISGVILYEETFYQKTDGGKPFVDVLNDAGILVGIKLDAGLVPLTETSEETISQGLDNLANRASLFKNAGGKFAKWRSVFHVSADTPSDYALQRNAEVLARYAAICQQNGLVPIIEPEVLSNGNHSLARTQFVTEKTLAHVYKALSDLNVYLEGTILKPNMVAPGLDFQGEYTAEAIADATITALRRTVPAAVPGIAFLSGGQSESQATQNLKSIAQASALKPWKITFSFGRALQTSALKAWQGKNMEAGQQALLARAKANSEAVAGL